MGVVESAREKIAFAGAMERNQMRVTFTRPRLAGAAIPFPFEILAIHEQVHFAREARKRRHYGAAAVILDNQLRDENWIGEVRERVVESLAGVHAAQGVEIGVGVFADEHDVSGAADVECGGLLVLSLSKGRRCLLPGALHSRGGGEASLA